MSVHKSVWVTCDLCGDSTMGDTEDVTTVREARETARRFEWVTRGADDYCDTCRYKAPTQSPLRTQSGPGAYAWFGNSGAGK